MALNQGLYRNSGEARRAIAKAGGVVRIAARILDADCECVTQLRTIPGYDNSGRMESKHIGLFHQLPASGRRFYEQALHRICRRSPFQVSIDYPFIAGRRGTRSVSLNISSSELSSVGKDLSHLFKDITPIEGYLISGKPRPQASSPRLSCIQNQSDAEAIRILELYQQRFKRGPFKITVVGLSLIHTPHYPPDCHRRSDLPPDFILPDWEEFPFLGVD